ncbi:hypothetical protein O0I10_001214 [Lichtheimia ornata]|uniref:Uncharacterized protein n=1 Tax=Lichtheimia ornata TaxID=688661 RepID=A0AAD7Y3D1_9FUNG|nr:uncharacterized protein O0I10_001214 [Lichtheimia ornata]KAJ8663037.1 hypothetical protein O0I10_001214 [Lichtheimia ornata]
MHPPRSRPRREVSLHKFVLAKSMLNTIQEHEERLCFQQHQQDVSHSNTAQQEPSSPFSIPAPAPILTNDDSSNSSSNNALSSITTTTSTTTTTTTNAAATATSSTSSNVNDWLYLQDPDSEPQQQPLTCDPWPWSSYDDTPTLLSHDTPPPSPLAEEEDEEREHHHQYTTTNTTPQSFIDAAAFEQPSINTTRESSFANNTNNVLQPTLLQPVDGGLNDVLKSTSSKRSFDQVDGDDGALQPAASKRRLDQESAAENDNEAATTTPNQVDADAAKPATTSKRSFDQVDDDDSSQPITSKRRLNQVDGDEDNDVLQPTTPSKKRLNQTNPAVAAAEDNNDTTSLQQPTTTSIRCLSQVNATEDDNDTTPPTTTTTTTSSSTTAGRSSTPPATPPLSPLLLSA